MKKRILGLCMAAIMTVAMSACSSNTQTTQQPAENTEETTQTEQGDTALSYDKIVVGLDDTFAPLGFRDEEGNLQGVDVELMEAASEIIGIPFE